jgi:hypothetical protein
MKKWLFIFISLVLPFVSAAQLNIKTMLPGKAVIVNEPFRIQFVVENPDSKQQFNAPDFNDLRIIRGPEIYTGSQLINGKKILITNYIYTLIANRTGDFKIAPALVRSGGSVYPGTEILITVNKKRSTALKAGDISDYTLLPGEDPYRKIKENLVVKLFVDKRSCVVGEPIVATFKLFSRLQSKSDIVKNPGFYGFSVYDMINLDDRVKETERINGKEFDVHTIRKVQLYPLQPGEYTIDEMKIENKIEFSRSRVSKKTEQQISEGTLNAEDENSSPDSEVFETTLVTDPVRIKVHALPQTNAPADFNGAAGHFTVHAALEKKDLDKNEEGFLLLTVEGKGNFTQLTAPIIQWPKELEGFEPSVKDFLDKRLVPLNGARIFRYPFISSQPGHWKIPATRFSFFNTATKSYQTLYSDSLFATISSKEFKKPVGKIITDKKKSPIEEVNRRVSRIAFVLVILLIVGAITYWSFSGRRKRLKSEPLPAKPVQTIDELFLSLSDATISEREYYNRLHQSTWKYLINTYNLSGTGTNKNMLASKLEQKGNETATITELLHLLNHFETAMFTNIGLEENRTDLTDKTKTILKQLRT